MVGSDDFMGEASIELSDLNLDKYVYCTLGFNQASTELGFNGKVRIPLGSFKIESEGSRKFPRTSSYWIY